MTQNLFSFLKSKVTIEEVVNHYTTIRKAGHYLKGCCPFHSEKTPSFTVSPDKNIFYCFGCHIGGDVIAFITKIENLTPLQAVYHLAERHGIQIPEELSSTIKNNEKFNNEKKEYFNLCQLVLQWCHDNFLKSTTVQNYIKSRGFSAAIAKKFELGYFPSTSRSIKALLDYIRPHSYLAQDLIEIGVLGESKTQLFSPFEERLMFPIKDHLGRCCGFGGRTFSVHDERSKYYNFKENNNFLKGTLLFGFDQAKLAIQKKESAFLVEGYTDCLMMVQYGFTNTIATLGTACTQEHLKILSRYAQTIYILYDGDQAGQKAILRLTELCWKVNIELKVIKLPLNEDPASFLVNGGDLQSYVTNALDIFNFFIKELSAEFCSKTLNDKIMSTNHLLKILSDVSEPLKQDFLIQQASKSLDIPLATLKRELEKIKSLKKATGTEAGHDMAITGNNDKISPLKTITELEKKLFSVIINNVGLLQEEDFYLIDYFSEALKEILKKLQFFVQETSNPDFISFFEILDLKEKDIVSKLLLEFQEYTHEKNFNHLFSQFQQQHWKAIVAVFKIKLARAEQEGNKNLVQKLLLDFQKFKKKLVIDRGA